MIHCLSRSTNDSLKIAEELAKLIKKDSIILLEGFLGAGKTFFAGALANALGITTYIQSPSYALIKEYFYEDTLLYHMDFYRLSSIEEAYLLDIQSYLNADAISIIEWFELIKSLIPFSQKEIVKIKIKQKENEDREFFIYSNSKNLNTSLKMSLI